MRNSWLALATKSTRICSRRRSVLKSRKIRIKAGWSRPPDMNPFSKGLMVRWKNRSTGMLSLNSISMRLRSRRQNSTASTISGRRKAKNKGRPTSKVGQAKRAAGLAKRTRTRLSTKTTGSGSASSASIRIAWFPFDMPKIPMSFLRWRHDQHAMRVPSCYSMMTRPEGLVQTLREAS